MNYWLFQANLKYSQILEAIQELDKIYWLITRYDQEITPGDRVLIWIAGKQAGIYAIAEVYGRASRYRNLDNAYAC
jgi:EVE domain